MTVKDIKLRDPIEIHRFHDILALIIEKEIDLLDENKEEINPEQKALMFDHMGWVKETLCWVLGHQDGEGLEDRRI